MKLTKLSTVFLTTVLIFLVLPLLKGLLAASPGLNSKSILTNMQGAQPGRAQGTQKGIKSEEKIIAGNPNDLNDFIWATAMVLFNRLAIKDRDYITALGKRFPQKGEFETSSEFEKKLADWKAGLGIDINALYKATGLFPLMLGKYNADRQMFDDITLTLNWGHVLDDKYAVFSFWPGVYTPEEISIFKTLLLPRDIPGGQKIRVIYISCPREKAINFHANNMSLRCDIVFSLDYAPNFVLKKINWIFAIIRYIKIYSQDTGDILYEKSSMKLPRQLWYYWPR